MAGNLSLDDTLWRYMAFDKFIDFINTNELYFASAYEFGDKWESYPPVSLLETGTWEELFKQNKSVEHYQADIKMLAQDAIRFFKKSYLHRDREYSFSCWTAVQEESYALWNTYTDMKMAVAIKSSPRRMLSSFGYENNSQMQQLFISLVNYIDHDSFEIPRFNSEYWGIGSNNVLRDLNADNAKGLILPFMYKQKEYAFAKEARVVFFNGQDQPAKNRLTFDKNELIDSIVIAPFANQEFSQHIREVVEKNLSNIKVNESRLQNPAPIDDSDLERNIPMIGRNGATGAYAYLACGTFKK